MTTAPLTLLRSTAPHAGLAALSAELWAAYKRLPMAQRVALAMRDSMPRTGESVLELAIAAELCGSAARILTDSRAWPDAMKAARAAIRETRGILHPDGRVTR